MMQTALSSIKIRLEAEHQTVAAVQDELTTAQQQQASLQHMLQQEQNNAEEQTRQVHVPSLSSQFAQAWIDVHNCSQQF